MQKCLPPPAHILDLGISNPFSTKMSSAGYTVQNTGGEDLDIHSEVVRKAGYDAVTAFEILEHMVNPFTILREINASKLFVTVPLRLWFAKAYWNEKDPFDRHFHEFEPRQLFMLLDKAGWNVLETEQWYPSFKLSLSIRSLLRAVTPRHLAVYCERK